jgi:hypothetical protein
MTNDAGSGFDNQAAGRDTGDDRLQEDDALQEETRHLDDDTGDELLEEARQRKQSQDNVNDVF